MHTATRGLGRSAAPEPHPVPIVLVDALLRVDETAFIVEGWVRHETARITRLDAVSPAGDRVHLAERAFCFDRPDVVEARGGFPGRTTFGFLCFFQVPEPIDTAQPWLVEAADENGAGDISEISLETRPDEIRERLFSKIADDRLFGDELMARHVAPALERLGRTYTHASPSTVAQFGTPPKAAWLSVVVPVASPHDRFEIQLSQLTRDPAFDEVDLVYVLDRSKLAECVLSSAPDLFQLYRVPFRVVVPDRQAGYAGASNLGARLARAPLVLRLHTDVIPARRSWLHVLRSRWETAQGLGALGPKLLFEDGTLEQAGVGFARRAHEGLWEAVELCRGLHGGLAAANDRRAVPAVSGACMLLSRESYERTGGLTGNYLQPIYEDIDLCLRLGQEGLASGYAPEVALYHLQEKQAESHRTRARTRYDSWVLSRSWGDSILKLVQADDKRVVASAGGAPWVR